MHFILILVLIFLIGTHLVQSLADLLNLKSLKSSLPREFADVFDPQTYLTAQNYTQAKTKLDLTSSSFGLIILVIFIVSGGLPWLDAWVRSLNLHPVLSGLIFLGLLGLAADLLFLPFQLYSTFVLEEKFGFNRMSLATFIQDKLKGFLLALLIGGPCLAGIILFLLSATIRFEPLFEAFWLEQASVHAGMVLFLLVYTPLSLLLSAAVHSLSRQHEFEADKFAVRTTRQPDALIQALKKLSRDNLSNLSPHPLKVFLEYSHPPVLERIRALRHG
ncbi:MAG: M48 family metalloprotease [Desulfovermiculus sp.]